MAADKHEEIRRRAYEIWENEGRPDGADRRHWLQASDELAGDDEHETMQDMIDEDDRDDAALLSQAGESGDIDRPEGWRTSTSVAGPDKIQPPEVEITTGAKPVRPKIRKTEGP